LQHGLHILLFGLHKIGWTAPLEYALLSIILNQEKARIKLPPQCYSPGTYLGGSHRSHGSPPLWGNTNGYGCHIDTKILYPCSSTIDLMFIVYIYDQDV